MILAENGLRVVRGPHWKWDNQDDGEGHAGTVVEICRNDKMAVVQWDSGFRGVGYRIGYQGAYDLRLLDNFSASDCHKKIRCSTCSKKYMFGMRWKCKQCPDCNLCNICYMSDKHDLIHLFRRRDTPSSHWVEVPKRLDAVRLQMKGVFTSAKVTRGPDWFWGDQDGGAGTVGKVTSAGRGAAYVRWPSGNKHLYLIGVDAKVYLTYTQHAIGGYYYRDHLPILFAADAPSNAEQFLVPGGDDKLSQDFKDLFLAGEHCDVKFKVKEIEFDAHKLILRARSPVLCAMLEHDMVERNNGVVNITDCDPDCFRDYLLYLYSGRIQKISRKNVPSLYWIADKYIAEELKTACLKFMITDLCIESFCDYITIAMRHNEPGLLKCAKKFFTKRIKDIIITAKWRSFLEENPSESNELLIYALSKVTLIQEDSKK